MSLKMDSLLDKLVKLHTRMSNTEGNLKKLGTEKITNAAITVYMNRLEDYWTKFELAHDELESKFSEDIAKSDDDLDSIIDMTERTYLEQKLKLEEWRAKVMPVASTPLEPETNSLCACSSRKTLPSLQLPHFSGKHEDWPAFRELFLSIIKQQKSITDLDRLHYLKMSLKGNAESLIRNLSNIATNYPRAWARLEQRYENQRLLVDSYFNTFNSLTKMKSATELEVRRVLDGISTILESLEGIERPITSCEDYFVYQSAELFDEETRREWQRTIHDSTTPPLSTELINFLEKWLQDVITLKPKEPLRGSKSKTKSSTSVNHVNAEKETKIFQCPLCQQDLLFFCKQYQAKSSMDRKNFLTEEKRCYNCLAEHFISDWNSTGLCKVCNQKHHTTIHDAFAVSEVKNIANITSLHINNHSTVLLATARVLIGDQFGNLCRALIEQGANISLVTESFIKQLQLPRQRSIVKIFGIGGQITSYGQVNLTMTSNSGTDILEITALIITAPKWWKVNNEVIVGRLCLIRNEATSPCKWPLARIVTTHPGPDGLIRVVTLRTAYSELQRPIVKIILLPIKDA